MDSISAAVGSVLHFVLLAGSLFCVCNAFNPDDNYLIDCGSATNTSIGNRVFRADFYHISNLSKIPNSVFANVKPLYVSSFDSSPLYTTARVFLGPFSYSFPIRRQGIHLLRLYFFPFTFDQYVLTAANFAVSIHDFVLLDDFLLTNSSVAVFKEYFLNITTDFLTLTFTPLGSSSIAFVNAIEVVSVPDDLIGDNVPALNPAGLSHRVLETVYRVNMGGSKVFPDQDALWRTWITDENFLVSRNFAEFVNSSETIEYDHGGAGEEIAPASVYSTGTEFVASNTFLPFSNLTWKFIVDADSSFMIRLHFCNIVSEELYFDVYINDLLAIKDLNLSRSARAAPFYADFAAGVSDGSGEIRVSIGPSSSRGNVSAADGMLNGLEIMSVKLSSGSSNGNITRFSNNLSEKKLSIILGSLIGALLLVIATISLCILLEKRRKM